MRFYGSDEVLLLKSYAHRYHRWLVNVSQDLPITIAEVGGTIRVFLGGDEDTRSEDLVKAIPAYGEWVKLVAAFLGQHGTGPTARRVQWRKRITSKQTSYKRLADELNQHLANLVGQMVEAADVITSYNDLFMMTRRLMDELDRQCLDETAHLVAYEHILDTYGDDMADASEAVADWHRRYRLAHTETRTLLRAGCFERNEVEMVIVDATKRMRSGNMPFDNGEPFTRERVIDSVHRDRQSRRAKQRRMRADRRKQPLEKAA